MTTTANAAADNANTTDTTNNERRFAPIFTATITPATINAGVGKNERPYATMKGALVQQNGKPDKTLTVMAFGSQLAAVQDSLIEGKPVDLAVQFDRGSLKIVGFPLSAEERQARKDARMARKAAANG